MNKLVKSFGELNIEMSVFAIVAEYMEHFNVKMSMTDKQIQFFSEQFVEQFGHESLDDLILCLKSAAGGKFGEIYNSIDPPILFKWFRLHLDSKYQEREKIEGRKKITMLKQEEDSPVHQELNKTWSKKIREELKERKEKEPVKGEGLGERLRKQHEQ
jgi:hypothetical protein